MKPAVIVLGIGVAAIGGYFYFSKMETTEAAVGQGVTTPAVDMTDLESSAADSNVLEDATASAVEATSEAVEDETDAAASSAAEEAGEVASDVVAGAATTAMEATADLLTVDGFDLDKVVELISGSSLDATKKLGLTTAVTQAKDNPELLSAALGQVKSVLGL